MHFWLQLSKIFKNDTTVNRFTWEHNTTISLIFMLLPIASQQKWILYVSLNSGEFFWKLIFVSIFRWTKWVENRCKGQEDIWSQEHLAQLLCIDKSHRGKHTETKLDFKSKNTFYIFTADFIIIGNKQLILLKLNKQLI